MAGVKVRCQCGHVFRLGPKQKPTPSSTKPAQTQPTKPVVARPAKPSASKKPPIDAAEIDKLLQPRDVSDSDSFDDFDDSGVLDQIIAASNAPPANPSAAAEVDELIRTPRFKTASTAKAKPTEKNNPTAAKSKPAKHSPPPSKETISTAASATPQPVKDYSVDDLLGGFDTPETAAPRSKPSTPTLGDEDLLEPLDDDILEPIDDDILEPIIEEQGILEPIIQSAAPPQGVYVPTPMPSDLNAPLTDPSLPLPGHAPGTPSHLLNTNNPYATPSVAGPYVPSPGRPRKRRRGARGPTAALTIPGIFLIVIGAINLLLMAFLFFVDIAATTSDFGMQQSRFNNNPFSNSPFDQGVGRRSRTRSSYAAGRLAGASIMRVAQVGLCIATILGGIAMAKASGFRTALVGSIVALVPLCTPLDCVLVEPAVGLWALIVVCVMKDQFTN